VAHDHVAIANLGNENVVVEAPHTSRGHGEQPHLIRGMEVVVANDGRRRSLAHRLVLRARRREPKSARPSGTTRAQHLERAQVMAALSETLPRGYGIRFGPFSRILTVPELSGCALPGA
jgi:hypothetical protein